MALPFAASKYSLAVLLLFLIASSSPCYAGDNITAILAGHPELGEFSSLLSSTGLTRDIMGRADVVTVLAVDNEDIWRLRAMPREAIRQHLSLHVLLGHYDQDWLGRLPAGESADLSTLYQPSGDAPRGVGIGIGMVKVSGPDPESNDKVSFMPTGNAAGSGVRRLALFVKSVYEEPDTVVLQVSDTMSAPWLPGGSARRDATGGDAAAADATGGGPKN